MDEKPIREAFTRLPLALSDYKRFSDMRIVSRSDRSCPIHFAYKIIRTQPPSKVYASAINEVVQKIEIRTSLALGRVGTYVYALSAVNSKQLSYRRY